MCGESDLLGVVGAGIGSSKVAVLLDLLGFNSFFYQFVSYGTSPSSHFIESGISIHLGKESTRLWRVAIPMWWKHYAIWT